ncbi:hypothetical protein O6H91_05G020800 [Diphasiastrum complanatum]|uniref:Uncharacterized protein n=1 Tax=Diphasiastrum complanatum TaxID=34168 RepID=A0ACC2DLR6_DIPCM|nr:hypothetical protein O6H91_05G020800 [Diphasiastrum complanatum]
MSDNPGDNRGPRGIGIEAEVRQGVGAGLGSGSGFGGIGGEVLGGQREVFREISGRGEPLVEVYRGSSSRTREEDRSIVAGGEGRVGGSFVAYHVGPEARFHAGGRDELGIRSTGALAASGIASLRGGIRGVDEEGKAAESGIWPAITAAAAATSRMREAREEDMVAGKGKGMLSQMRNMDVIPLAERLPEGQQLRSSSETELQLQHFEAHTQGVQQPGSSTCKECGNHAKKDCVYQRCRTCCKSRNFDCPTHIKSTWVPAAKRRERQVAEASAIAAGQPRPKSKRLRSLALVPFATGPTSTTPTSTGNSTASLDVRLQQGGFKTTLPTEVRAQTVFKCVRVTGIEDGEDEIAYQATVNIGGHIFKGVLYDQGLEQGARTTSHVAELQLGGRSLPVSSSTMIDPTGMYGASGPAGLLGGEPF